MKRIGILSFIIVIVVLSCVSTPKPQPPAEPAVTAQPATPPPPPPEPVPQPASVPEPVKAPQPVSPPAPSPPPAEPVFDRASITEERFEATKADVQKLIDDLNRIIKARNYNAWRTYLADSYFEEISSKEFLDERTEELYKRDQIVDSNLGRDPRRTQKKLLRTPKDYFDNVVVPSRSNDRMDDIDFISDNRVKAYTVDNRGQWVVLYDLEYIDNKWKIVN